MISAFKRNLSLVFKMLAFSSIIGWIVTSTQYNFGVGDLVEQLPIVLRLKDPSYLINDFYVNSTQGFGPRYIYSLALGWLTKFVPLTTLYFSFVLINNILVCFVTMLAVWRLSRFSKTAPFVAGAILFAISFPDPIADNQRVFYFQEMISRAPAYLLLLTAILFTVYQKPVTSSLLAGISSLLHPQLGIIMGWILLGTSIISSFVLFKASFFSWKTVKRFIAPFFIQALFSLAFFIPGEKPDKLPGQMFFDIYARFRIPHHILPEYFPGAEYLGLFFTAVIIFWVVRAWWVSGDGDQEVGIGFVVLIILIALLCLVGGYIFVDLIPTRAGASIQAFRFVSFLNWLLPVFTAIWVDRLLFDKDPTENGEGALILLSAITPITLFITSTIRGSRLELGNALLKNGYRNVYSYVIGSTAIIVLGLLIYYGASLEYFVCGLSLLLFLSPAGWFSFTKKSIFLIAVTLSGIFIYKYIQTDTSARLNWNYLTSPPIKLMNNYPTEVVLFGKMAKEHTPPEAVILTPPNSGQFRLLIDRALVVDFKSFVFQEPLMKAWYERINDCFGPVNRTGFNAAQEMESNYHHITREKLLEIKSRYGATYAILFSDTQLDLPSIVEGGGFKLVAIE